VVKLNSRGSSLKTKLLRPLVFSAVIVLLFLSIIELLLRGASLLDVLKLPKPQTVREAWAREGWTVDKDLNWALLPKHSSTRGGAVCRTNSHGLRDQEIPLTKPGGTYRILVLGDSTVLGFAIPFEKTFSELLEKMLNEKTEESRFDVINAGVPGYSIYNCSVYLKRDGLLFQPDLIVLETNFNDRRFIMSTEYEDGQEFYSKFYYRLRLREFLGRSFLYRGMRRALIDILGLSGKDYLDTGDFDYELIDLEDLHCRIEPDRYRKILAEIIELSRSRGIPVVLVPLLDPPSYVSGYYRASALAKSGNYEDAVPILRELYQIPFYRIIAARKMNEFLDTVGRHDKKTKKIPIPLKWMSTDGNIPVYLCDPYVEIMRDAAREEAVITVYLDPLAEEAGEIYLDYIHLNERGHRLLAEKLFAVITASKELNFPL
jgi:lysophospholipase L1-like esterase